MSNALDAWKAWLSPLVNIENFVRDNRLPFDVFFLFASRPRNEAQAPRWMSDAALPVRVRDRRTAIPMRRPACAIPHSMPTYIRTHVIECDRLSNDKSDALSSRSFSTAPNDPSFLNTLALARYWNGKYAESLAAIDRVAEIRHQRLDAYDWYCRDLGFPRLGQELESENAIFYAKAWITGHTPAITSIMSADLKRIADELTDGP